MNSNTKTQPEIQRGDEPSKRDIKTILGISAVSMVAMLGANKYLKPDVPDSLTGQGNRAAQNVNHLTTDEVKDISNFEAVTVKPGEGVNDLIAEVDPESLVGIESSDGEAKGITQVIESQTGGADLQEGQNINVPVIPGRQDTPTPTNVAQPRHHELP